MAKRLYTVRMRRFTNEPGEEWNNGARDVLGPINVGIELATKRAAEYRETAAQCGAIVVVWIECSR